MKSSSDSLDNLEFTIDNSLTLKWKLSIIFGFLGVICILVSSYVTYLQAFNEFNKELGGKLLSVAQVVKKIVAPNKLEKVYSVEDPYYRELKGVLSIIQQNFNLAWLAIYRYNGTFFTHIVDGSPMGSEFIPDFPIMDMPEEMKEALEGHPTFSDSNVDAYGSWFTAYCPIINASGTIVGLIDVSKNNETLSRFKTEVTFKVTKVAIILTLLTLLICFLFSQYLTRSIAKLTEGAKCIAKGDLNFRITGVSSQDEIGVLVNSFNFMASEVEHSKESLERKIFELSTLFEISQKINFAGSTQEILKLILEKSVNGLKAERGSILLFDEETEVLSLNAVYGPSVEPAIKRIAIKVGEGVAGKVFFEMQPLILNNSISENFKPYGSESNENGQGELQISVRNIMCLPLLLEKRAIGVINIVNKVTGDFQQNDLSFANTMAAQIALTIEKSRLYELSITDGLTKLFVHRYFQLSLENEIRRAKRYGKTVGLILFDIDHFKKFNDTYGHQTGDQVLIITAQILKDSLRGADLPARYGGEEFVVILPETEIDASFGVAERLRKAVEAYDFPSSHGPLKVTISLGIAAFPMHASDRSELIRKADKALYLCKERGRNCASVSEG